MKSKNFEDEKNAKAIAESRLHFVSEMIADLQAELRRCEEKLQLQYSQLENVLTLVEEYDVKKQIRRLEDEQIDLSCTLADYENRAQECIAEIEKYEYFQDLRSSEDEHSR